MACVNESAAASGRLPIAAASKMDSAILGRMLSSSATVANDTLTYTLRGLHSVEPTVNWNSQPVIRSLQLCVGDPKMIITQTT
jgi:hypothetical protein